MTETDDTRESNQPAALQLTGSIQFGSDSHSWGSQRRMALLQAIDEEGSISAGARKIGISYKAAWDAVDTMNSLAGEPLVMRNTGGQRGGGAQLTSRAKQITALYQTLDQVHERFVAELADLAGQNNPDLGLIRHLMVKVPGRNKLNGTIMQIVHGPSHSQVHIALTDKTSIVANVPHATVSQLEAGRGAPVVAFIDPAAIMIGLTDAAQALSARNQLPGTISHIHTDDSSAEIVVKLCSGTDLVIQVTPASIQALGLQQGLQIYAIFKASSVVLGAAR